MTPVVRLLLCFWSLVVLVTTCNAYGVKNVDLSSGQRSGAVLAGGDLIEGAAQESTVEYVENGLSLEPLYDFLIQLRLHKLCKLFRQAQLEDVLLDTGPLTIFAPTDGSFVFLPGGTLDEIQRNPQWLRDFILHHIVAGDISSEQIQDELVVTSLQGSPLRFNIYGSGQVYTVSGAQILSFDLPFQLGRLHVIDHPLYPIPEGNIVGYLQSTQNQLYRLLLSTGLAELLSGGTYTIFAPDDKAFGYLSQDFLNILNTNRTLAERILLNHVLHASIYTRGITNGMQLESVGGGLLTFTESRGLTFVNGVPIVSPDIPVTNGVIHIINRVLLPEDVDTDCHCKSSKTGTVPATGQDGTSGDHFGSRQPQIPGSRVGSENTGRPAGQVGQPGTSDSPYSIGKPQTPSSVGGTGSDQRPGRPGYGDQIQRPGSPITGSQTRRTPGTGSPGSPHDVSGQVARPGTTPGRENIPTGGSSIPGLRPAEPFVTGQVQGGQRLPQDRETQQIPGDNFVAGQPQLPESTLGTGHGQRPGSSSGTGQPQTPGSTFSTVRGQTPGSSFGTGQLQTPGTTSGTRQQAQRPGSSVETGYPQTPGSTFGTGQAQRPGSSFGVGQSQVPGSAFGTTGSAERPTGTFESSRPQSPGSTFGTGQDQRRGSHVNKGQTQRPVQGQGPGSTPGSGYPQRPWSGSREPQRPGSGIDGAQSPGSASQPGYPQRPGISVLPGQSQRPESVSETGYPTDTTENEQPQLPGGTFEPGHPERTGTISRPGSTPVSPGEQPGIPGKTKVNKPGRIPLPPPPTRAHTRTRTTQYPGNQQRWTPAPISPQGDRTQSGGSSGGNVRGPYRPTRTPTTQSSRYPGAQSRVTPTQRPQITSLYPDSPRDSIIEDPDQALLPGRTDTRKQPSAHGPHSQPGRHRTPQPTGGITPGPTQHSPTQRPSTGQLRPVPTRAPVSRPGFRPITTDTTNCRQPGDRITSSNRNFPICSTQDINEDPCQSLDQPYDPSDPRPICPGSDIDQTCRDPLKPPAPNDRRPACRVSQGKPVCRKYNEPRDGRPLCPGSVRNCRLPEEPENPLNPLPLCQEVFSVEGCRSPNDPYDPQDRRPECPPDDCRPPQEPLRQGDKRPLCTVNEEDYIRQPIVPTTANPRYPQQPRPGNQPPRTPGTGQSRPGTQPSPGSRPQTPSWQQPQTSHSPAQPTRTETFTTRKPGKQPQNAPTNPGEFGQPISADDNDALLSPVSSPAGRPGYPGSSQSHRRQGHPSPGINDPSGPQPAGRGTSPVQPQVPDQSRPGRPHTAGQRPSSGQTGIQQTTPQRPSSQSGSPNSQRPSSQDGRPGQRQPVVPQPPRVSQQPGSPGSPSASGGDDSARSLLDIVQDPGLKIKGHPVKLTIILDLFQRAGLINILEDPGTSTVFLPSDDAFKKLPRGVVEQLGENPDLLREVLLYHVIASEVRPTVQETSITVPTLQGMRLVITMLKEGRLILIGGAKAVAVTRASNGIFYVINELLYPLPHEDIVSALNSRPDLTQVTSLIKQSGLTNMLTGSTPHTLFAPTDAAFRDLPESTLQGITQNSTAIRELLLGHIVQGAHFGREFLAGGVFPNARGGKLKFRVLSYGYTVNDVNIKTPEIVTGTGVIHLIDQVLLEPDDALAIQEQQQSGPTGGVNVVRVDASGNYESYPEIAELARGMGLNRFLSWITNTGLIEKVNDGGSYTILAPTDAAVNTLPDNLVQAIDSDPDQVRPLLKFHIITQHIDLNNIRNEQTASTLLPDKKIRFNVVNDGRGQVVTACGIPITEAQGSGSVRLIAVDQALYPPTGNLIQVVEASPILQNFAKAIRSFHLTWMLNGQGPTTVFAPSDAAFEALSDEDKKNLIENRQAFTDLLKRHIVKGSIFSSGIRDGMKVRNEKREDVTFSVHPGGISVNSIPISYSDVTATNGVLHVIDHFL